MPTLKQGTPPPQASLLGLPVEIRTTIYEYTSSDSEYKICLTGGFHHEDRQWLHPRGFAALTRVCHITREEVLPLKPAFRDINFQFSNFTPTDMGNWIDSISGKISGLKKFEIMGQRACEEWYNQSTKSCCPFQWPPYMGGRCNRIWVDGHIIERSRTEQVFHDLVLEVDLKGFEEFFANAKVWAKEQRDEWFDEEDFDSEDEEDVLPYEDKFLLLYNEYAGFGVDGRDATNLSNRVSKAVTDICNDLVDRRGKGAVTRDAMVGLITQMA